ncbi:hypothetical protein EVAR_43112_1 [Eumeta japonica]|uniref:Uncharacterized protein n=1 Tax=Eumeta variegata TaxID=151549 RepID=A0A4C1YK79_EUMVA|nr:hypothetical protein EVAR_43112_1 [Eumeta japonica]
MAFHSDRNRRSGEAIFPSVHFAASAAVCLLRQGSLELFYNEIDNRSVRSRREEVRTKESNPVPSDYKAKLVTIESSPPVVEENRKLFSYVMRTNMPLLLFFFQNIIDFIRNKLTKARDFSEAKLNDVLLSNDDLNKTEPHTDDEIIRQVTQECDGKSEEMSHVEPAPGRLNVSVRGDSYCGVLSTAAKRARRTSSSGREKFASLTSAIVYGTYPVLARIKFIFIINV